VWLSNTVGLLELSADAEIGDRRLVQRGEVVAALEDDVALVRVGSFP
jgi:hypothetical protein